MVRNNRHLIRLYFLILILVPIFVGQSLYRSWQLPVNELDTSVLPEDADWIDMVSSIIEALIQLFFGLSESGG